MRERVRQVVEARWFQRLIIGVILFNAATLGVETSATMVDRYGWYLHVLDQIALYVFVVEMLAKLYVYRLRFFTDPWNLFDAAIVSISFIPAAGEVSVLRALRILRALRLISAVPSLRRVVAALLSAIPGMASIALLLALVLYVAAVMAAKLFGATSPEFFGDLPTSLFTLFQMMTGDAWSDIAREVMAQHPMAWVFFIVFVLICTFVVLNLFIAVVVNAMEEEHKAEEAVDDAILTQIAELRAELREMRELNGHAAVATAQAGAMVNGAGNGNRNGNGNGGGNGNGNRRASNRKDRRRGR
ncbi:ion transporter [Thermopolyspora sp. NPDC052614]|uniref:ion transporter n=1 Tax=Thermopolyspora sp. NPDC052614 TaxID=3155682 RepID=UPI00341BBF2A